MRIYHSGSNMNYADLSVWEVSNLIVREIYSSKPEIRMKHANEGDNS